jgi:hypothetical protein
MHAAAAGHDDVRLYPGNYVYTKAGLEQKYLPELQTVFKAPDPQRYPKAVAFDLDETLGTFADLYLLWVKLKPLWRTQAVFHQLLALYPEFLRVGIVSVLSFLREKMESGECLPIYIYTNNQCACAHWVEFVLSYFDRQVLGASISSSTTAAPASSSPAPVRPALTTIFARPVCAYKIGDQRVEPNRTTHHKTYRDFVSCSMLHDHTHEMCFIDDQDHLHMKHRKVYFIQPPPYHHRLAYECIVGRFVSSDLYRSIGGTEGLVCGGMSFVRASALPSRPPPPPNWLEKEREITQKIMYYVREFFFVALRRKTTRRRKRMNRRYSQKRWNRRLKAITFS